MTVNGEATCIAGADGVLNLSALIRGNYLSGDEQGATLTVDGTITPLTTATWLSEAMVAGDKVELEVVQVAAEQITLPGDSTEISLEEIQAQ